MGCVYGKNMKDKNEYSDKENRIFDPNNPLFQKKKPK